MRILLEAFFLMIMCQMPINIRFQKTYQIDSCSILIYFHMNRCTLLNQGRIYIYVPDLTSASNADKFNDCKAQMGKREYFID